MRFNWKFKTHHKQVGKYLLSETYSMEDAADIFMEHWAPEYYMTNANCGDFDDWGGVYDMMLSNGYQYDDETNMFYKVRKKSIIRSFKKILIDIIGWIK